MGVVPPDFPVQEKHLGGLAAPAVDHIGLPLSSDPVIRTTSTNQLKMCVLPSVGRIDDETLYFVSLT